MAGLRKKKHGTETQERMGYKTRGKSSGVGYKE